MGYGYGIEFVSDAEMPEGHDFALIATGDGALILYRESAVCPAVLEESWAAYRALSQPTAHLSLVG